MERKGSPGDQGPEHLYPNFLFTLWDHCDILRAHAPLSLGRRCESSAGLENILINLLLPDMDTCVPEATQFRSPSPPITCTCFGPHTGCSDNLHLDYGASQVCPPPRSQKGCAHKELLAR